MLLFIGIWCCFLPLAAQSEEAEQPTGVAEEPTKIDIKVKSVSVRINPTFELALPSGTISQHFIQEFNNLSMEFNQSYNLLDNNIAGDISFRYPLGEFTPQLQFIHLLDFENDFAPDFEDGELSILPSDRYIFRQRGGGAGVDYNFATYYHLMPEFFIYDTFRGSLTTDWIIDEGLDLLFRLRFFHDSMEAKRPLRGIVFNGIFYDADIEIKFRDHFNNPIGIDLKNGLLVHTSSEHTWFLEERVSFNIPLWVFKEELTSYYSLGGYDSYRGSSYGSLKAFRFFLASTTLSRTILPERSVSLNIRTRTAKFHQFRLVLLNDLVALQKRFSLVSEIDFLASIGGGISFVISGKNSGHIHVRAIVVQSFKPGTIPVLYFRTSLFSI